MKRNPNIKVIKMLPAERIQWHEPKTPKETLLGSVMKKLFSENREICSNPGPYSSPEESLVSTERSSSVDVSPVRD